MVHVNSYCSVGYFTLENACLLKRKFDPEFSNYRPYMIKMFITTIKSIGDCTRGDCYLHSDYLLLAHI